MFGIFNDCFPPVMDGVSVATRNYAYWLHQKGEQVCVVTPSADEYEDREPFPVLRYCSIPLIFRNPYRMGLPQFDRHIRKSLNELPFLWYMRIVLFLPENWLCNRLVCGISLWWLPFIPNIVPILSALCPSRLSWII